MVDFCPFSVFITSALQFFSLFTNNLFVSTCLACLLIYLFSRRRFGIPLFLILRKTCRIYQNVSFMAVSQTHIAFQIQTRRDKKHSTEAIHAYESVSRVHSCRSLVAFQHLREPHSISFRLFILVCESRFDIQKTHGTSNT